VPVETSALIRTYRARGRRHVAVAAEDHRVLPLAELRIAGLAEGERAALYARHPRGGRPGLPGERLVSTWPGSGGWGG
jgi:hypothetical protein